MSSAEQAARAERLRGYFDLQLDFASRMAALTELRFAAAVDLYTNLRMRMALALADEESAEDAAQWGRYLAGLADSPTHANRLDWTQAFFAGRPPERLFPGQVRFGCFRFEAPDADGIVRIHFANRDSSDGVGPLATAKIPARMAELTAMFGQLQRLHPEAKTVTGGSWLYNLEAYRRLFPAQYGDSRVEPTPPVRLRGTSSWGQFLDFREQLKPDLCVRFRDNLRRLDPAAPWLAFPFLALRTRAPVEAFYGFYGLDG
jgi:hypothetical protein